MYVVTGYLPWMQFTFYTDVAPKAHEAQSSWLVPGTHDDDGLPLAPYRMNARLDEIAA